MELFEYDFMRKALLGMALIAPACAMMGVQVVHFRLAYFSDAISHSAFTAVALAVVLGANVMPVMLAFGVLVAWGVFYLRSHTTLSSDAVIGVLSASIVALGLAGVSPGNAARSFESILFGSDVLLLGRGALVGIAGLLAAVCAFELIFFNRMMLIGIDRALARSQGIRAGAIELMYTTLLAVVVLVAIQFVGLLLVTAMLVIPAATGRNLARSAAGLFWWPVGLALVASVAGLFVSFYADLKTGPCVVLLLAAFFFASVVRQVLRPA